MTVTANNPVEPVDGGVITFTAASTSRASATLSAASATIAAGQAAVTATANDTAGSYSVTATAAGAASARFSLTNSKTLASSGPIPTPAPSPTPGSTTTAYDVVLEFDNLASLRRRSPTPTTTQVPTRSPLIPSRRAPSIGRSGLTGGPLVLTNPATTTIIGPGARLLTISGGGRSRVFDIRGGSLALEGLTITGGRADRGGGILNDRGTLALDHVVLRGNRARVGGGLFNDGRTALSGVVIKGNRAPVGSGMFNTRSATLLWRRSPATTRHTSRVHHAERE